MISIRRPFAFDGASLVGYFQDCVPPRPVSALHIHCVQPNRYPRGSRPIPPVSFVRATSVIVCNGFCISRNLVSGYSIPSLCCRAFQLSSTRNPSALVPVARHSGIKDSVLQNVHAAWTSAIFLYLIVPPHLTAPQALQLSCWLPGMTLASLSLRPARVSYPPIAMFFHWSPEKRV